MTEAELAQLEAVIQAKLPEEYRQWALRCSRDEEFADGYGFHIDADWIISRNVALREDGWDGEEWKPNLLCIGTFEAGDYFIDLTDLRKGVYFAGFTWEDEESEPYDPEDYSSCWVATFAEFARGAPSKPKSDDGE